MTFSMLPVREAKKRAELPSLFVSVTLKGVFSMRVWRTSGVLTEAERKEEVLKD